MLDRWKIKEESRPSRSKSLSDDRIYVVDPTKMTLIVS